MKRNLLNKVLLMLFALFILSPFSQVYATGDEGPLVYDYADLLTDVEKGQLEELAASLGAEEDIDFIILTTNDTEGKDIKDYVGDFYDDKYNLDAADAAILTLDMERRDVHVAGFYKGKKFIDDKRAGMIREKITPDLSAGNYYSAFSTFIEKAYEYMGVIPGVNPESIFLKWWFHIIISVVVAGGTVGLMAYNSGGRVTVNSATYLNQGTSRVLNRSDQYLRQTVTKRRKPQNNNSGGGGFGGGGGGITRGGHSFSGSRGKF